MKIVILDGYTLNPGDLSWEGLQQLGSSLTVHDRTPRELVVERARDAEIVFTNKTPLSAETLEQLPRLRYVGVLATGYNIVDTEAAAKRRIPVTNIPAYGTDSVAQMVFAHILNFARGVETHARSVRRQEWAECEDFSYWVTPQIELNGTTLGLIGLGKIGGATARLALAFGMNVIAYKPTPPAKPLEGVEMVDLETVFRQADFLSLHCPLTDDTHHLVNEERLALMKPSALLINTGRGPLIDEEALARALSAKAIAGAALDVLAQEPPPRDHPLFALENCTITPHMAWATYAARQRLMRAAEENLRAYLYGQVCNVVNDVTPR